MACSQGICLGSGIGNFDEIYDTVLAYDKGVSQHTEYSLEKLGSPFVDAV